MGEAIAFDMFNHSNYFINIVENSSHRIKFHQMDIFQNLMINSLFMH